MGAVPEVAEPPLSEEQRARWLAVQREVEGAQDIESLLHVVLRPDSSHPADWRAPLFQLKTLDTALLRLADWAHPYPSVQLTDHPVHHENRSAGIMQSMAAAVQVAEQDAARGAGVACFYRARQACYVCVHVKGHRPCFP